MQNPDDANAELGQRLTDILRALADDWKLDEDSLRILCYGCGIDARDVIPPPCEYQDTEIIARLDAMLNQPISSEDHF